MTLNDSELQKHYDAMFDMFASDGWARLMEDAQKLLTQVSSIEGVNTLEELHRRKGERVNLQWLLTMRANHERSYESLLEDQADAERQAAALKDATEELFREGRATVIE